MYINHSIFFSSKGLFKGLFHLTETLTSEYLQDWQVCDPDVAVVQDWRKEMARPEWPKFAQKVQQLRLCVDLLCFRDDVLYVIWENKAGSKVHC